jgi:uncharacterized membrane protein (DUF2068 family)
MNRPKTYTIAAILQFLYSAFIVVTAISLLARGATATEQAADSPPYFIIVIAFVVAVLGIVSAYGVWRNQKWGVLLTIILRAVDGLAALPGLLLAPTLMLKISAWVGVLGAIVIIALLLWPKPKLAS